MTSRLRWSWLALPLVALVGCSPNNPPVGRCDGVRCTGTDTCELATGLCVPRNGLDAGRDAGLVDGGEPDASVDAGEDAGADGGVDSGIGDAGADDAGADDAGLAVDAGADGGSDAGAPVSSCSSNGDCFGAASQCDPVSHQCVECLSDAQCVTAAPKCDPLSLTCVECLSTVDCANPVPVCAARVCVDCSWNAQCGAGKTCDFAGDCQLLPDSCANPRVLNLPGGLGTASLLSDPGQALDDSTASCNAPGGPELVYTFTIPSARDVTVSAVRAFGSTTDAVISVRSATCTTGAEIACAGAMGGSAALSLPSLAAGTYFVFVESAGGVGPVQLDVSVRQLAMPPANDSCISPEVLTFLGTRAVTIGDTTLAANDSTGTGDPSCSPTAAMTGRDLTYRYTTTQPSNVTVTVRPVQGSALHPVVSTRATCAITSSEFGCSASAAASATAVSFPGQDAGTYFVWVDSADSTLGGFQLQVDAVPVVANDTCSGVIPVTITAGLGSTTGDTTFASNGGMASDPSPSCSPSARSSGADLVYSYTLAQPRDVTVQLTPTGSPPSLWPVLSVRSSACTDMSLVNEQGCSNPAAATPATLSFLNQPAGTYFVWVDGAANTTGPFQLSISTASPTPPPANDTCGNAQALVFDGGAAFVASSTAQAANDNSAFDVSPTCSPTGKQSGRDVVYSFTLPTPRDVTLALSATSGSGLHPGLYVRKANCESQLLGDELVCLERPSTAVTTLTNLAAGTYWVWVDGVAGTSGAFSLLVTLGAPTAAPANDDCAGAQALAFDGGVALASASTFGASNSNSPNDNAPACGTDFVPKRYGRDLLYTYTLAQAQDVDVRVTPTSGSAFVPAVYARATGQCTAGGAGSELACIAATQTGPVELYLPNQPAGTYPLFVDSNSYDTGAFSLQVSLLPATLPPGNDACVGATALTLGTPVNGATTGALDTYSSVTTPHYGTACGGAFFSGRDVVYSFTAPSSGTFTATVTPTGAFDPVVMLLTGSCTPAQCVRLANLAGAGGAEALTFSASSGQTVWFVVDALDSQAPYAWGAFSIRVQ